MVISKKTKVIPASCAMMRPCYGTVHSDATYDYDSPPFVFLPRNTSRLYYLPTTDTLTILTAQRYTYRIQLSDIWEDSIIQTLQNDSVIRIHIRPWKKARSFWLTITVANNPRWEPMRFMVQELGEPKKFQDKMNSYIKTLNGSSQDFAALSMAYFYEKHKLFIEAHSLFRKLYYKDKDNEFYKAAYYNFLFRNEMARAWSYGFFKVKNH